MLHKEVHGRDQISDPNLRPLDKWQITGDVKAGEIGAGCPVDCLYCNQMGMDKGDSGEPLAPYISFTVDGGISLNSRLMLGDKLDRYIPIENLVTELQNNPFYTPKTPLYLENFNDPGLDWSTTVALIDLIISRMQHEGPIVFITKMGINPNHVEQLVALQSRGAKLIGIVTYSGMPEGIEKSSDAVRIATLRKLYNAGIPTILSMRPLIRGINDSTENIDRVLRETMGITNAVICGGLFVFDTFTADNFERAGYPLDPAYLQDVYSLAKKTLIDYKPLVRERAEKLEYPAVVHSHTTCAVSDLTTRIYERKTPDRFPHWFSHSHSLFHDCSHCPEIQRTACREVCNRPTELVIEIAENALKNIGYTKLRVEESRTVPKLLLVVDGALCYEELAFLREQSGWYVDNLPNREGFLHRAVQAVENDLIIDGKKYDYRDLIVGEFLLDQEWFVVFAANDQNIINPTIRWLRSRVRNRVQYITSDQLSSGQLPSLCNTLVSQANGRLNHAEVLSLLSDLIQEQN